MRVRTRAAYGFLVSKRRNEEMNWNLIFVGAYVLACCGTVPYLRSLARKEKFGRMILVGLLVPPLIAGMIFVGVVMVALIFSLKA